MTPPKSFELLLDEVISTNVSMWLEEKHREPEQLVLIEEDL